MRKAVRSTWRNFGEPPHGTHGDRHLLRQFRIEHPTEDDNRWAMRQVAHLYLSHSVQLADAMIASVAVRLAVPLYTTNLKHFQPLPAVDAQKPY